MRNKNCGGNEEGGVELKEKKRDEEGERKQSE